MKNIYQNCTKLEVQIYLLELQITPIGGVDAIMSKLNNPKNNKKYYQMCTKKEMHIFNRRTTITQSLNIKE